MLASMAKMRSRGGESSDDRRGRACQPRQDLYVWCEDKIMAAPIAFFVFNRPGHVKQSLAALAANTLAPQSDLVIYCDGPRSEEEKEKTDAVRALCRRAVGFKSVTVVERSENFGCERTFVSGLMEFFGVYPEGVIIEDDIVLAPNALHWFNLCLERYREEPVVFSIAAWSYPERSMTFPAGYSYDAYFLPRFQCWGWASWADRVQRIDWGLSDYAAFLQQPSLIKEFSRNGFDLLPSLRAQHMGTLGTWDIQAAYSSFKHGQVSLAPRFPYATNIGTVGDGTHVGAGNPHPTLDIDLALALDNPRLPEHIVVDESVLRNFSRALRASTPSLWMRVMRKAQRFLIRKG